MSLALSGIGVSRGIAIGKAHFLRGSVEVLEGSLPESLLDEEVARFLEAVETERRQLES
jgi:phosphotransferase system enzyme I (PtsI)